MAWTIRDFDRLEEMGEKIVGLADQLRSARRHGWDTLGDTVQTPVRDAEEELRSILSELDFF